MIANVAGNLLVPLINKKAIKAEYRSANARQLQSVYNYQRVILNAGAETGTQLVLTAATAPWYPLTHAKSSAKSTRRAGVPCAESIGR